MVEWLAGNRLRGTTAERPNLGLPSGSVGGWVELARTTLGSAGDTIDVTSLPDKRYYMLLNWLPAGSGNHAVQTRINADTGSNYAYRFSDDGGTDGTGTSNVNGIVMGVGGSSNSNPLFGVTYVSNLSTKEKLSIHHGVGRHTAGAANAPARRESVSKWVNTVNAIDQFTATNFETGDYNTGAELVVLGWDPANTHTSNFWEELASVDLSGGAATYIDSGTITAKKYLWYMLYTEQSVDSNYLVTFNSDTGSNYALRYSNNDGADSTLTSQASISLRSNTANLPQFFNGFIINNSTNEKLLINHNVNQNTAGAGTAPNRGELVGKWDNTSNQITAMRVTSGSGNLASKTTLKIWGAN